MDLKELEAKKEKEVTGFFWLGLQIAFIFGVPAILAVLLGKRMASFTGKDNIVFICLVFSFVFSWILVAFLYKKKSKRLSEIEEKIKQIKNSSKNIKTE